MKDKFELEIDADGTMRTIHQEGIEAFAEELGGEISTSCRASNIEWEELKHGKGWVVRSAYDANLALRYKSVPNDPNILEVVCTRQMTADVVIFKTREEALKWEVAFFWELLAPRREQEGK